jgi:protocatechuate 3,4-dioxygenase beta subunit/5-hydroxyisourate hydrolase-like protein (transthyretin family)
MTWFTSRRLVVLGLLLFSVVIGGLKLRSMLPHRPSAAERAALAAANDWALHKWDHVASLSGRVVTSSGAPAAGAKTVLVVRMADDTFAPPRTAVTDAQGRFRFDDLGSLLAGCIAAPVAAVHMPGWGWSFAAYQAPEAEAQVRVRPGAVLRVSFLDPNGNPARGLRIKVVGLWAKDTYEYFPIPPYLQDQFLVTTDARGAVSFPGLPLEGEATVEVDEARYAALSPEERQVQVVPDQGAGENQVRLAFGATLSGRVVYDATGEPAAGVRVGAARLIQSGLRAGGAETKEHVSDIISPGREEPHDRGSREAVTDAQGRYRITRLGPGSFNVALDLRGPLAARWTAPAHEAVSVSAGDSIEGVDFALVPGAVIKGRAYAKRTGLPLAGVGASVYGPAHPRSGMWAQTVKTGADGTYSLRVPPGQQYLYLQEDAVLRLTRDAPPPGLSSPSQVQHDLSLTNGQTVTVDWAFSGVPIQPIAGRVLDSQGRPAAYAEVIVIPRGGKIPYGYVVRTDARGQYRLGPVRVLLRARSGRAATPRAAGVGSGGCVDLHLQPDALATVAGTVLDPAGDPLPGAKVLVTANTPDPSDWHGPIHYTHEPWGMIRSVAILTTGPDGSFFLTDLWPNQEYTFRLSGESWGTPGAADVELKPGEHRALAPLRASSQ